MDFQTITQKLHCLAKVPERADLFEKSNIGVVTDRHLAAIQLTVRSSIRACSPISRGLGLQRPVMSDGAVVPPGLDWAVAF